MITVSLKQHSQRPLLHEFKRPLPTKSLIKRSKLLCSHTFLRLFLGWNPRTRTHVESQTRLNLDQSGTEIWCMDGVIPFEN